MRVHESYNKIERVMFIAGAPIAPHEFGNVSVKIMSGDSSKPDERMSGRQYVGQSESAIGRRLREMRALGRVTSQRREGTAFVEYDLVKKAPAVHEPELAGQHSGGL